MSLLTVSVKGAGDISILGGSWCLAEAVEEVAPAVKAVLASAQAVRGIDIRLTDAARGGPICGTQLLQYIALILSSDNDAAQLRLVLPIAKTPVVPTDSPEMRCALRLYI